ncbi:MAG: ABC transporter substrate-binding protein, partial [Halobaculum sp.]
AVDDRTVEIELADPYHAARDVLAHSAFSILPAGAVDDVPGHDGDRSQAAFAADPVGCGPFRFESWEPERSVRVGAFEAYHGERPSIPGIEFVLREDPDDERYTFELADEIDVFGVAPTKYDPSRATVEREDANGRRLGTYGPLDPLGETVNFTLVPTLNTFYLGFNTDRVPRAVRRAVAYATDRSPVEEALAGRARPAYHLTPPALFPGGVEGYDDHAADYPYGRERRPDAARETLAEAGYGPDDPWELTLTTYRYRAWETLGAAFADQLADVGIDLTVEVLDLEAAVAKNRRGESEAYAIGWLADWPTLDSVLRPADPARSRADADQRSSYFEWGETPAAERARTAYARLADTRGRGEEPQETRNRAALDVETALWEDVPLLPVYHHSYQTFFREYVDLPPMGSLSPGRQKLHTVRYTGPRP